MELNCLIESVIFPISHSIHTHVGALVYFSTKASICHCADYTYQYKKNMLGVVNLDYIF